MGLDNRDYWTNFESPPGKGNLAKGRGIYRPYPSLRQIRREAERRDRKEAKKQQSAQKGFLN